MLAFFMYGEVDDDDVSRKHLSEYIQVPYPVVFANNGTEYSIALVISHGENAMLLLISINNNSTCHSTLYTSRVDSVMRAAVS